LTKYAPASAILCPEPISGYVTWPGYRIWIAHHGGRPEGQALLEQADSLATALHELIAQSWRDGQPPPAKQRRRIEKLGDDL